MLLLRLTLTFFMALWQYEISAYPKDNLNKNTIKINGSINEDILEELNLWSNFTMNRELEKYISSILDSWKAWGENMKLYWSTEHNDIHLYQNSGVIVWLTIRIDLRTYP